MSHTDAIIHDTGSGWSISKISNLVEQKFGIQEVPCWFQVKIAMVLYEGKDVIGITPTGAGKTLFCDKFQELQ